MADVFAVLWMLTKGIFKLTGKCIYFAGRFVVLAVVPATKRIKMSSKRLMPTRQVEASTAKIEVDPATAEADTGPATVIQVSHFEVADRIVGVRLEPAVGVIHLRVYNAARVVKRDLIIHEPQLKALMQGRRHAFSDAEYNPKDGLDAIKEDTIELAEKLINDLGSRSVKAKRTPKKDFAPAKPEQQRASAPVQARAEPPPPARTPDPAPPPPAAAHAAPTRVVAPRVKEGFTYVGQLVRASAERQTPPGRAPFEVFTATLLLDNGAEMALRGAELERELTAHGCNVGGRVAITPMGKVPVDLANGEQGAKNLYRVQKMASEGGRS